MLKGWLKNVIYAGLIHESSADVRKQILISSLVSLLCFVLMTVYGLESLLRAETTLAAVVLFCAAISGINYLFLCRTGKYSISSLIIVILMTFLGLYLLCTGGRQNTGPLWFFVLPGLIFYVLGFLKGFIYLGVLLAVASYILLIPDNPFLQTEYSLVFIQRFAGALFSVCFMTCIYEYSREDGRKELIDLSQKLDQLSRKDELTGLSNRRDMFERLRDEVSRYERSSQVFSVLIADIDDFKSINDNYGHECGDEFLRGLAKVLFDNTQKRDRVARWGGEEFLIFLPETDGGRAEKSAERLRKAIENHTITYEGNIISATTSIGVAEFAPGQTLNELINAADKCLYLAKRNGRNCIMRAV